MPKLLFLDFGTSQTIQSYKKALRVIVDRIETIKSESVSATIGITTKSTLRGVSNNLKTINELTMEELKLKNKYNELVTKIERVKK